MILGTLVGVLPGIGPALTIALLLPITFNFDDPVGAFILFAGIYAGGMYGGSTTSILLNTPGESSSVATAIEGFEMAKRGRGRAALATAAIGSFVAGTIGIVALTVLAEPVASLAVKFRAEDYFALTLLAFASVTALTSRSLIRGFTLAGRRAADRVRRDRPADRPVAADVRRRPTGQRGRHRDRRGRAVRGRRGAAHGGAAALPRGRGGEVLPVEGEGRYLSRSDWRRSWKPWLRGAGIGFPFGALPAGGAEVPTFLSYATERRLNKDAEWGEGAIEGVAGPEAANNASFSGTLVPLLTLGIPTSATAAIMLAAFQIFNLQPGPELFERNSELVWTLIASLYVANVMLLLLNLPLVQVWVQVLDIPRPLLYSGILVFGTLGVYSLSGSTIDVIVMYAIGVMGFFMRRYDFPIAPVILGVILGPLMETQARRALVGLRRRLRRLLRAPADGDPAAVRRRRVHPAAPRRR